MGNRWDATSPTDTRAAQLDQSQGRPTTNTGSQPIEQERPAHTYPPKAPVPDGHNRMPDHVRRASRTPPGPPARFIPGTNAIDQRDRIAELPSPEDHQESRALPHRRRR